MAKKMSKNYEETRLLEMVRLTDRAQAKDPKDPHWGQQKERLLKRLEEIRVMTRRVKLDKSRNS